MNVRHVADTLGLKVLAGAQGLDREITGGYASDLLSCVMASAVAGSIWVTLQAHPNVVAVADLLGLAGVIITEDTPVDAMTLQRANERGMPLLHSPETTFTVVGRLVDLGIQGVKRAHQ